MPVILELEEYEADLVVAALMEGRIKLMKEWGDRYRSPDRSAFEDDLVSIDEDIVSVAAVRERLKEGIMWQRFCQERSSDPRKRVSVAWHREHGWLPTPDFEEKLADDDNWPYEDTEADDPVTTGIDTQAAPDGKIRIDIVIGGKTASIEGNADLLKTLSDLSRGF